MEWMLGGPRALPELRPEEAPPLREAAREAARLLGAGNIDEAMPHIDRIRASVDSLRADSTRVGMAWRVRAHAEGIDDDLRYPNRAPVDIPTRYAQFIREHDVLNGVRSQVNTDPTLWQRARDPALELLFNTYPATDDWRSLMTSLDRQNPLPESMREEFAALRTRVSAPHQLVREAAAMVHRYTRTEEAKSRNVLCRDASELFRKLMTSAGIPVRMEMIASIAHAYNLVEVGGTELFVDTYFHPAGPMVLARREVEAHGLGTPDITNPPRY